MTDGDRRWQTVTDGDRRWQTVTDGDRRWQTVTDGDRRWQTVTDGHSTGHHTVVQSTARVEDRAIQNGTAIGQRVHLEAVLSLVLHVGWVRLLLAVVVLIQGHPAACTAQWQARITHDDTGLWPYALLRHRLLSIYTFKIFPRHLQSRNHFDIPVTYNNQKFDWISQQFIYPLNRPNLRTSRDPNPENRTCLLIGCPSNFKLRRYVTAVQ